MSFETNGKLFRVFDTESKSSTFQTREFVLEIPSGNYNEYVKFQLTQDRCNLIDQYSPGDALKVSFDLRGREWQGKFFTNLQAWRIESSTESNGSAKTSAPATGSFPTEEPIGFSDTQNDDLPF